MQQKLNKNGPFYSTFFLFNFVAFGCISLVSKDGNIYVHTRYFSFYLCLFARVLTYPVKFCAKASSRKGN